MATGILRIQAFAARQSAPVEGVTVNIVGDGFTAARMTDAEGNAADVTLTAPGCGMGEVLVDDVRSKLELIPTVAEADVELVFDPPWGRSMMSELAKLETGML